MYIALRQDFGLGLDCDSAHYELPVDGHNVHGRSLDHAVSHWSRRRRDYPAECMEFLHGCDKFLVENLIATRPIMNFPLMAIMFMTAASITQYLTGVADDATIPVNVWNPTCLRTDFGRELDRSSAHYELPVDGQNVHDRSLDRSVYPWSRVTPIVLRAIPYRDVVNIKVDEVSFT